MTSVHSASDPTRAHLNALASTGALEGLRVLDLGCGTGATLALMLEHGADAIGLEVRPEPLALAQAAGLPRDRLVLGDGSTLPFDAQDFDLVVTVFSFHHVPAGQRLSTLAEIARVLRPNGRLLAIEPLPHGPMTETMQPIEDETEIRTSAQALLAAPPAPFHAGQTRDYSITRGYADAQSFIQQTVAVDPDRRAAAEAPGCAADVAQRLARFGRRDGDQLMLDQPVRLFECHLAGYDPVAHSLRRTP